MKVNRISEVLRHGRSFENFIKSWKICLVSYKNLMKQFKPGLQRAIGCWSAILNGHVNHSLPIFHLLTTMYHIWWWSASSTFLKLQLGGGFLFQLSIFYGAVRLFFENLFCLYFGPVDLYPNFWRYIRTILRFSKKETELRKKEFSWKRPTHKLKIVRFEPQI